MQAVSSFPRVCIVVPAYQGGEELLGCLESVAGSDLAAACTIVVDNASTDGSIDRAEPLYPAVEYIRNPENVGFGVACNQAITIALERGMEYVLLLNQDARLESDTLRSMVSLALAEDRAAAVGPRTLCEDLAKPGHPLLLYNGSYRTLLPLWQHIPRCGKLDDPADNRPRRVDYVWGHAMLLRVAALREVGQFDPRFFMYYEDLDLCWRFQKAGWQNWCDSRAVAWHHIGNASRSVSSERWRWQMKASSKRHFYRKHAQWYAADLLWLLTCSREMIHLLGNRYWTASRHLLRAVFRVACGFPEARPGD